MAEMSICPGCGVKLPDRQLPASDRFNASGECWELFCRLSGTTASNYDDEFIHQLATDTYEAQHAGGISKNIAVNFGLIGLYLTLERGYTGCQVQAAHIELARRNKEWPKFDPPTHVWPITIGNVVMENTEKVNEAIRAWAQSVWRHWGADRGRVVELVAKYLPASN